MFSVHSGFAHLINYLINQSISFLIIDLTQISEEGKSHFHSGKGGRARVNQEVVLQIGFILGWIRPKIEKYQLLFTFFL